MLRKIIYLIIALCLTGCSSSQQQSIRHEADPESGWPERYKSSNISFDILIGGYTVQIIVEGTGIYDKKPYADPFSGPDTVTIKKPSDIIDVDVIVGDEYYSCTYDLQDGHYFIINYFDDKIFVGQTKDAPYYE